MKNERLSCDVITEEEGGLVFAVAMAVVESVEMREGRGGNDRVPGFASQLESNQGFCWDK